MRRTAQRLRSRRRGAVTQWEPINGYPQHDHLHCQRLIEFQSDELLALRDRVAYAHHFRVSGHRLIVTGLCASCWEAPRRRGRRAARGS